jgi:hypothetical protein
MSSSNDSARLGKELLRRLDERGDDLTRGIAEMLARRRAELDPDAFFAWVELRRLDLERAVRTAAGQDLDNATAELLAQEAGRGFMRAALLVCYENSPQFAGVVEASATCH